ncbi:hypothetical protein [Polyangium sorediatum]|uniref:Outer membrane protein beta-barrel domain-containing protein n=1 Tax=Polyangium sorediatum TaxID=889274 RepID=A0ABT6P0Q1_9BACT|nr:hypothetical protein [Polyangium sorediatum]MDI1434101.1 hypothetical protein [Polyangium sorediatum]
MNVRFGVTFGGCVIATLLGASEAAAVEPRTPFPAHAALDAVGGSPAKGAYVLSAQGGWPFSFLRAQVGLSDRITLQSELESAVGRRYRPMLGIGVRLAEATHVRLTGEFLAGWLFQRSEEYRRGPNGELRFRLAIPVRRFVPYLVLGTRHAFLPDLLTIERSSGTETSWSARHEWTPWATLGLGFAISRGIGLDLGINYGWVGAPDTIALPGVHLGLHFGGDR